MSYLPEDIWHMILHEFLWPKNNKYWLSFKSRDALMLELTKQNLLKYDIQTKKLCNKYLFHSNFYKWIYIPNCLKEIELHKKYKLLYDIQLHIGDNIHSLTDRIRIIKRYLKYRKNNRYAREKHLLRESIHYLIRKNNYLINTKLREATEIAESVKLKDVIEELVFVSKNVHCHLSHPDTRKLFE